MSGWIEADGLPVPIAEGPLPAAVTTGDIQVLWDNTNALGDWGLAQGDLQTGQDLETACLVSLFTDALATPDFIPTDGTGDRRGWWADTYEVTPPGSNLWQLDRAKKTRDTLGAARGYTLDALQWLIDDGVAKAV
jgi:phage gp46-like protein